MSDYSGDYLYDLGKQCGRAEVQEKLDAIAGYDQAHGIESDAYADYEAEQRFEHGGMLDKQNPATIGVYFVTGDPEDPPHYISSREARVLAASLLRAADDADASKDVIW